MIVGVELSTMSGCQRVECAFTSPVRTEWVCS